jgi:serine/threonine protein kinase
MIIKTLGSFQIHTLLGRGGMGEVYQAKDQKLGREVAIKVLPEEFAKVSPQVHIVLNWFEELKKKVPVD